MNARIIRSAGLAAVIAAASITLAAPARAGHAYGHERGDWDDQGDWRPDPQPYCESAPPPCPAPTVVYGPCPPPVPVYVAPSGFIVSFSNGSGLAVSAGFATPLPAGYGYQDPYSGATYVTYADWSRHFGRRHPYRIVRVADWHRRGEWREHGRWGRD